MSRSPAIFAAFKVFSAAIRRRIRPDLHSVVTRPNAEGGALQRRPQRPRTPERHRRAACLHRADDPPAEAGRARPRARFERVADLAIHRIARSRRRCRTRRHRHGAASAGRSGGWTACSRTAATVGVRRQAERQRAHGFLEAEEDDARLRLVAPLGDRRDRGDRPFTLFPGYSSGSAFYMIWPVTPVTPVTPYSLDPRLPRPSKWDS